MKFLEHKNLELLYMDSWWGWQTVQVKVICEENFAYGNYSFGVSVEPPKIHSIPVHSFKLPPYFDY